MNKKQKENQEFAVNTVLTIIRKLYEGGNITVEGEPYPIAMGEDFSIGYLYNNNRVIGELTFKNLLHMVIKNKIVVIPKIRQNS